MKVQAIALRWAWYIWKDAVASWSTQFPSTVRTWSDACKEAWILAKEEFNEARDNAVKTARKVLGVVREFVISSASVGEVTVNPDTTGRDSTFEITCTKRDVYTGNGTRRKKRAADLRPAMNAAINNQLRKEYRP